MHSNKELLGQIMRLIQAMFPGKGITQQTSMAAFISKRDMSYPSAVFAQAHSRELGGPGALDLLRALRAAGSPAPVVVLGESSDMPLIARCMAEGATDFLVTPAKPATEMLPMIGRTLELAAGLCATAVQTDGVLSRGYRLSPGTRAKLDLLMSGYSDQQVADLTGVARATIAAMVNHCKQRLGARDRMHLAAIVLGFQGVSTPPPAPGRALSGAAALSVAAANQATDGGPSDLNEGA